MQRDPRAFLWDVREAAQAIRSFTEGLDAKGYVSNELVQAVASKPSQRGLPAAHL